MEVKRKVKQYPYNAQVPNQAKRRKSERRLKIDDSQFLRKAAQGAQGSKDEQCDVI